jgi:hypothetical protein
LAQDKTSVRVLDFVSDVRRIAAALDLNREAAAWTAEHDEPVLYKAGEIVKFQDNGALKFFHEYLADVAELEDASEESRLQFPPGP